MDNIKVKANDKGYRINFTVKNSDDTVLNLTGYTTIKLKVWRPGVAGTLLTNGSCTIANAALGTCYYLVTATDFTIPGRYAAELELTNLTNTESSGEFLILVEESG
jgi:hypothetical protein